MVGLDSTMPQLNLRARPLLLGLTYRALAGAADGGQAPLTQRKIEHAQAALTTSLQRASELRADVGVAREQADKTRKQATQSDLDLRLFLERYEEPPRGLLRRLTPQQRAAQQQRADLESIAGADAGEADNAADRLARVEKELKEVEARLATLKQERAALAAQLGEQLAAHVLGLVAAGEAARGRDALELARAEVRGDVMVGSLLVLVELFAAPTVREGTAAARAMLGRLEPLFSAANDATPRALALLLALLDGRALGRQELGLLRSGNFSHPAHWRLYQLVCVLAGGDATLADAPEEWLALLRLVMAVETSEPTESEDALPPVRDGDDTSQLLLGGAVLLAQERLELLWRALAVRLGVPRAAALDLAWQIGGPAQANEFVLSEHPNERSAVVGPLLAQLSRPIPAWPQTLHEPVISALACLTQLSLFMATTEAQPDSQEAVAAPQWLYEQWLAESYGWPKSDLYWWMLAALKGDSALLRNITRGEDELFIVP